MCTGVNNIHCTGLGNVHGVAQEIWCKRRVHSVHVPHPKTASELHSVHVHEMSSAQHTEKHTMPCTVYQKKIRKVKIS